MVRHLPAGSPSIFYTIHSLAEKAHDLCREVMTQENDLWQNWQGQLEPCKKILDLLLRLLSIVDIQVNKFHDLYLYLLNNLCSPLYIFLVRGSAIWKSSFDK